MAVSGSDLIPAKPALRRWVQAQRRERTTSERAALARAIASVCLEFPALRRAGCVAAYASRSDEPDTSAIRSLLRARGTRVLLPVVRDETTLDWAEDHGPVVESGPLRLPEPASAALGPGALALADLVLVPALAVDTRGRRLGRGRGYYDRALISAAPGTAVLALVFDAELLDADVAPVPAEPHDVRVGGAITPTRWMLFPPPRA